MGRRRTRSDAEVLEALGSVLRVHGPHGFTLAHVGAEVGLAPATLVQRFGSKRGLLLAFVRHAANTAEGPFEAAAAAGGGPVAVLRRALWSSAAGLGTRAEVESSLALLLEDVRDPELREAAGEHARRVEAEVRRLVEEAVACGELVSADPAALAATVHAAWNGALLQWALRGDGPIALWADRHLDPLLGAPR